MSKDALTDLETSNVWDARYGIPGVPSHLNPHIYAAYTVRILEACGADASSVREAYQKFLRSCEPEPGLITTYPGSFISSHDDAYGAGFLSLDFALRCSLLLSKNDGTYAESSSASDETKNLYRFFFFRPAMRAFGGLRVGLVSQLSFIAALLFQLLFTKDGDTSDHLLLWLAFPEMRKTPLVARVIEYWSEEWEARGYTPKKIFKENYLTECPWFGEFALEKWT